MILSQKIRIYPNNKSKAFIEKSFGVSRFTYNWILEKFNEDSENFDIYKLKREFNSLKKTDFAFTFEVGKYASQEPFMDFKDSLRSYYKNNKKVELHFRRKKDDFQSFYVGGDHIKIISKDSSDKLYIKLPKMLPIKLNEKLRFNGHITGCRITRKFEKYYVSISFNCDFAKRDMPHNDAIGIDLGIKNNITLSNGLIINYPEVINKHIKRIKNAQKVLSRKVHPRTKDDPKRFSNNYQKQKRILNKRVEKLNNIKRDFEHKISYILANLFRYICVEDLPITEMQKDKIIARKLQFISFFLLREKLDYKCALYGSSIIVADRYYASSKICSICGSKVESLGLNERTYKCLKCGNVIDRDINAAVNLKNLVGRVTSDLKPLDLDILIKRFNASGINVSKIEEGKQHKACI